MLVIKEAYLELAPHGSSLADVVVLSQAWKKSHALIRRHNWYADVLELDASMVDLEAQLLRWGTDVHQVGFRPHELLLVPASKIAKWEFRPTPVGQSPDFELEFDDWAPKTAMNRPGADATSSDLAQKLRPLAHLSIRDQTLATAVMMCMAEAVETAQGNTFGNDVLAMREQGVVSYGNRLQCNWVEQPGARSRARFSWGNSRTYRQYFQD